MEKLENKVNLLREIEGAEAYLTDDIQALAYLRDEMELTNWNKVNMNISEWTNRLEIILKSMLYNQSNMQIAIKKAYEEKKQLKEGALSA